MSLLFTPHKSIRSYPSSNYKCIFFLLLLLSKGRFFLIWNMYFFGGGVLMLEPGRCPWLKWGGGRVVDPTPANNSIMGTRIMTTILTLLVQRFLAWPNYFQACKAYGTQLFFFLEDRNYVFFLFQKFLIVNILGVLLTIVLHTFFQMQ